MPNEPRPPRPADLGIYEALQSGRSGLRTGGVPLFSLVELSPEEVVDGERANAGFVSEDAVMVGKMREKCPHCGDVSLQLVLRYQRVIRPHLYCERCTRCYDAVYPDGRSALLPPGMPSE